MHEEPDAALRAAFAEESRALCQQGAETACRIALPLLPAFALLDLVVCPDVAPLFLGLRLACTAAVAVVLVVLRSRLGPRHPLGLGLTVVLLCGGLIDGMTVFTGREASPYYAGTNLVLLAMALILPLPPTWTAAGATVLILGYLGLTAVTGPIVHWRLFANNLAFLSATGLIAVVSAVVRERLRWREFTTRRALAEALRHRSEFMAKMSHELRTPIHVMVGYADILLEEGIARGGSEARDLVDRIRGRGVVLHRMISDLLDYAKIEAGKVDIQYAPVDLDGLLAQAADAFRPLAQRRGLAFELRIETPLPEVSSDGARLEQILTNLVGNAIKFTERGGVRVVAACVERGDTALAGFTVLGVSGGTHPAEPGVLILVEDSGIGIHADDLLRLAADFQQVDGIAERYGGTGLGLSISKRLASLLGGVIAVRSTPGHGSSFVLWLPAPVAPLHAVAGPIRSPSASTRAGSPGSRSRLPAQATRMR